MELFESVFNKTNIYESLFFNIKSVLKYPTVDEFEKNENKLFNAWVQNVGKYNYSSFTIDDIYLKNGYKYPELNKIVAITYATLYLKDGEIKRFFKKIVNNDENIVIDTFIDILQQLSLDGVKSTPHYFPTLCGYDVINTDIPLLLKRFVLKRNELTNKTIPLMLKKVLSAKPWDSTSVIDVSSVWKFNGNGNTSLSFISEYLGLKKTVDLLSFEELNKYYWENIEKKPEETLSHIALQSATQTNLVIQLMNDLRYF